MTVLFLIVVKVLQQEPYDKKILAKFENNCNIYYRLVLLLKLDTQRILRRVSKSETQSSTEQNERQFCESKIKVSDCVA